MYIDTNVNPNLIVTLSAPAAPPIESMSQNLIPLSLGAAAGLRF